MTLTPLSRLLLTATCATGGPLAPFIHWDAHPAPLAVDGPDRVPRRRSTTSANYPTPARFALGRVLRRPIALGGACDRRRVLRPCWTLYRSTSRTRSRAPGPGVPVAFSRRPQPCPRLPSALAIRPTSSRSRRRLRAVPPDSAGRLRSGVRRLALAGEPSGSIDVSGNPLRRDDKTTSGEASARLQAPRRRPTPARGSCSLQLQSRVAAKPRRPLERWVYDPRPAISPRGPPPDR